MEEDFGSKHLLLRGICVEAKLPMSCCQLVMEQDRDIK